MSQRFKYFGSFDFQALRDFLVENGVDHFEPNTHKGFMEFWLPDYNVYIQAFETGTLLISFKGTVETESCKRDVEDILKAMLDPVDGALNLVSEKCIVGPKGLKENLEMQKRALELKDEGVKLMLRYFDASKDEKKELEKKEEKIFCRKLILRILDLKGPLTRNEITRETDIHYRTVLVIMRELIAEGIVAQENNNFRLLDPCLP